jgi:glycosyltransferase involved in cell wall biosynthesis
MRILQVHNEYLWPGGEDVVVRQEKSLLAASGHDVIAYLRSNREIRKFGPGKFALLPFTAIWSRSSQAEVAEFVERHKPDVAHVHNTFALISPSALSALKRCGVPVVMTLHNYRLFCARADFFRDGRVCEDCVGTALPWPAVAHGCYHESRVQTAAMAAQLVFQQAARVWERFVDKFLVPSAFSREICVRAGLPATKVVVKPNFVSPVPPVQSEPGTYGLYVGRLSPEKRIRVLIQCWRSLPEEMPLRIVGDGPMRQRLVEAAKGTGIRFLGQYPREEVMRAMLGARFLVFPSQWYEVFPITILEAFACGLPVIASRLGVMPEMVRDGDTGLLFAPGDVEDLNAKVRWAWSHDAEMREMGRRARLEFQARYTPEENLKQLLEIYTSVLT